MTGRLGGRLAATTLVGLIAVLTMSGCGLSRPSAAIESGTAQPMTPTSTPTATPPPSPSPTPTAGITLEGIGGLKIGGSFAEAGRQAGATPDETCPWLLTIHEPWTGLLTAQKNGDTVSDTINLLAMDSWSVEQPPGDSPRTDKGIGLGSSRAEVEAAYPTARLIDDDPNVDFALRYIVGAQSLVFEGRSDVVKEIQVLPSADPVSSEYCG